MAGPIQRLIQFVLRGKDEMSPAAQQSTEALEALRAKTGQLNQALDDAKGARGLVTSLTNTQRAVGITETSLGRAEKTIVDLREALNQAPDNKGLEVSLKTAEKDAATLRRTLDTLNAKLAEQEQAAKSAGVDTSKLADEEKRLAAEVSSTKEAISQNAKELRDLERDQARARRETENHVSRVDALRTAMAAGVRQAAGYAAAFIGIQAAFALLRRGVDAVKGGIVAMLKTGDEFEGLQTRLTSLMGSVEGGEQATAWITKFAKDTPLQLSEVTDAFALMKAYGLDPMDGTFKALEDQSEKLGGGMERLTGIATAVGQAWAKQKLQTEEILQLVERGVPVWDMLSKVTGKNAEQLQDLASKGKLGRDVIKALVDEMERSSAGAAAANMSRLSGLISNLEDTATNFLNRIAKSGALDYVKGRLQALADTIAQMDKDGSLDRLAAGLSDAFIAGAKGVEDFVKKLAGVDYKKLIDDGVAWLGSFKTHVAEAGAVVDQVMTAGKVVTATLSTVWNGFSILVTSSAATLAKGLQLTVGSLALGAGQIANFFGGSEVLAKAEGLYEFLGDLSTAYAEQAKTDAGQIADAWRDTTQSTTAAAGEQAQVITEHFDNLKTSAQDSSAQAVQAVTGLQNALDQISAATTVAQLTQLQEGMRKAFQEGKLSQEDYANGAGVLNARMKELQKAAGGAALGVSDLSTGLESLKEVQSAIANAKTSADIQNIRTALNKLYNDGKIKADEFNQSQKALSEKIAEMKAAGTAGAEGMDALSESTDKATQSLEEQRKAIGDSMEAQRQASGFVKEDMSAFAGFFASVMTTARQPLAELSQEALAAFDNLRGLSGADVKIDTSSLESTTKALQQVRDELGQVQALATMPGVSPLGRWAADTIAASRRIQVATLEQKQELLSLLDGYDKGTIGVRAFIEEASKARNGMNLLNDSDLRQLESTIDSAKQRMQQLGEGSKQTLASLQEELAGLRGEQEAADRSKFNSRKQDLQAQLADAQKAGDLNAVQNLMQALGTLQQIQAETDAKRQLTEQQALVDKQNAGSAAAPPASEVPTAPSQPMKIIRLETPRGTVDVGVTDDGTALLQTLQLAGMRTSG
ncbi:tape measure protein [Pseudomonas knackmussii]|uniref:tape measure protein n=1 Tax=Pseudomonas knackmussii TaxID=65741 RepID=UPI00136424CD|nr:tape measure protein [Pseudomonas knackmussii]